MKETTSETTPGELLTDFNSRGLKKMIIFTVVVHVVLVLATSGSYIWHSVTGTDTSKLGENERLEIAVKEAQAAVRRIAEQHGIKPQDLGNQFNSTSGVPKGPPKATPNTDTKADPKTETKSEDKTETKTETKADTGSDVSPGETAPPGTEKPNSAIEKELKQSKPGPTVPTDEDLFK